MKSLFSATVLSLLFTSSIHAKGMQLEVSEPILNKEFPSASGAVFSNNKVYAIGDDSPYLFELDADLTIQDKLLIKHYPIAKNGRIVKKVKPDFEAMDEVDFYGKPAFVILGSGSKAHKREWAFLITQDQKTKIERSLRPLYQQIYKQSGFSGKQKLNIEGLASTNKHVFVLNRGNSGTNVIFRLRLDEFVQYLEGQTDSVNEIVVTHVQLPVYQDYEATLSGAEYWPEAEQLVFTASIEATGDAYNDGDILGSFVGTVPVNQLGVHGSKLDLTKTTMPVMKNGQRVITKVETVAITESSSDKIKGVLLSDNDDGTSELFHFGLTH
ncbi:hypothetical protein OPW32_06110 [Vibrio europaeus]|uniref:DUF6929 family protein n=1 Tax=Vibrio europaeus TaxID=300876 RepID=UPI00233FB80C|nr:hypothetical protein [Vibrio europaeus]MDC5848789.1 hypothetical protein [Vibrio europaeus]